MGHYRYRLQSRLDFLQLAIRGCWPNLAIRLAAQKKRANYSGRGLICPLDGLRVGCGERGYSPAGRYRIEICRFGSVPEARPAASAISTGAAARGQARAGGRWIAGARGGGPRGGDSGISARRRGCDGGIREVLPRVSAVSAHWTERVD